MNKIMRKFLPKDIIIIVLGSIFITGVFLIPGIMNISKGLALESYYLDSDFDFVVMSPGQTQCQEIEKLSFINSAIPFYRTDVEINLREEKFTDSDVLIFDSQHDWIGPFSEKRLINEIHNGEGVPIAYVDYNASKEYGLNEGDTFFVTVLNQQFEFCVSKVFKTAFDGNIPTSVVMLFADANLIDLLSEYPYSGAYITASNYADATDYLESEYIAKGDLRERDYFESDEAYEQYNNTVLKAKHYVIDLHQIGSTVLRFTDTKILGLVYCIIGILVSFCLLALIYCRKSGKRIISSYFLSLFRLGVRKNQLKKQLREMFLIEALIANVVCLIGVVSVYKLYYLPSVFLITCVATIFIILSIVEAFICAYIIASNIERNCIQKIKLSEK